MSLGIRDSGGTVRNVLEVQDLAPGKFACIANVAEPIVSSNNSIDGTGSSASPLAVVPSVDAGNSITLGTDGKIYTPSNTSVYVENPNFNITQGNVPPISPINISVAPGVILTYDLTITNSHPTRSMNAVFTASCSLGIQTLIPAANTSGVFRFRIQSGANIYFSQGILCEFNTPQQFELGIAPLIYHVVIPPLGAITRTLYVESAITSGHVFGIEAAKYYAFGVTI